MDCSTFSNKTACTEIEDITNGELSERYYLLKKQFDNLTLTYEATKQQLHDVNRNHEIALAVQTQLGEELENHQAEESKRRSELNNRILLLQEDISALRKERTEIIEQHSNELKELESQVRRLKEEQEIKLDRRSPEKDTSELEEARAATAAALADSSSLKLALKEVQTEVASWRLKSEELITEIQELKELAENRRTELRAAAEREAAVLSDLAEAKAMLHQCSDAQNLQSHAAKGNSIFAEVEDKRQEMAETLVQMKQTNSTLKRELAETQAELEALLHEKQTIWEHQIGVTAQDDRELIECYEERITQLEGLCERQRRELARWFGKLGEPEGHGWLPGVLHHLRTECERLRVEVLSRGAAQLASAAQIRELRRTIAVQKTNSAKLSISPIDKHKNGEESKVGNDLGDIANSKTYIVGDKNNTANGKPNTEKVNENGTFHKATTVQIKSKLTKSDVKKKVSFN